MKKSRFILAAAAIALTIGFAGCGKGSDVLPDKPTPDNPSTKTYTVTFVSNGGSDVNPQTVTEGELATEPTAPSKADNIFAGWFTDKETFSDRWDFATRTINADVTLYANWLDASGLISIYSADDLNSVRNNLAGSYILMDDISLSGYSSGAGWVPIGTGLAPFTGKFDGNGHKITDLTIDRLAGYVGLFGCINSGGSVCNLGVEIADGGINGGEYTGGLAGGVLDNCTITDCYSTGAISGGYSGGISGYVQDNSTITDCCSTGNISGDVCSGGIVGDVWGGTIINCYSTGNCYATYDGSGGIVGDLYSGTITNCYSTGNIAGASSAGITGYVYGSSTITNCAAINHMIDSPTNAGRVTGGLDLSAYNPVITISQ